jgi:hypothetical protein
MDKVKSLRAKAADATLPGESIEAPDRPRRTLFAWQAFLIGGLAFFLVTNGVVPRPGNLDWLMEGDRAMNLLGWMFFRNGPVLQQPFGANWQEGMDISSSIVYTDSISLMAFLFKPFNAWLPERFQYFGIWLCFVSCSNLYLLGSSWLA